MGKQPINNFESLEGRSLFAVVPAGAQVQMDDVVLPQPGYAQISAFGSGLVGLATKNLRRFDAAGNPVGASIPLNLNASSALRVGCDSQGNSVVVWAAKASALNAYCVFAQLYSAQLVAVGNVIQVSLDVDFADVSSPDVAVNDDGSFTIAWLGDTPAVGAFTRRYGADGAPLSAIRQIYASPQYDPAQLSMSGDKNGRIAIVWQQQRAAGGGSIYDVLLQQVGADDLPIGQTQTVNDTSGDTNVDPQSAIAPDGTLAVTWGQTVPVRASLLRTYSMAGNAMISPKRVFSGMYQPVIAVDAGNVITIASPGSDNSSNGVYARRTDTSGHFLGGVMRINDTTAGDQTPDSIAAVGNTTYVAWSGWDSPSFENHNRLRGITEAPGAVPSFTGSVFQYDLTNADPPVHRIQLSFDAPVWLAAFAGDVQLENLTAGNTAQVAPHFAGDDVRFTNTTISVFRQTTGSQDFGILTDGNWRVRIPATSIGDRWGNSPVQDVIAEFFVLAADANRDRKVDMLDFNLLAGSFGLSSKLFSQGNFNYLGKVDSTDFNIFTGQHGKRLPAPSLGSSTGTSLPDVFSTQPTITSVYMQMDDSVDLIKSERVVRQLC